MPPIARTATARAETRLGAPGKERTDTTFAFGEVNASTVSAPDQTLMYLRVSRSVGISVSAGPRNTMPGGMVPMRTST